jgi:hypothetical protein
VRALDRDDVARLLHDADQAGVTALVGADPAARALGEVEADLAQPDLLLDLADRVGEGVGVLGVGAQDVEGQPLRGARTDARQLAELGDQPLDRRRVQG